MARPGGYARAVVLAALLFVPRGLAAQQDGGATGEFRYTEGLRWEDDELRSRSDLGFTYSSRTRSQYVLLDMFGGVDKFGTGEADEAIADPRLRLDYGLESRNAALDLAVRYLRSDVDSLIFDDAPTVPEPVIDDGTRENASVRLGLELGREAPFGASLSLGYEANVYSDTTSPLLIDDEALDTTVRLRFDIDPRVSARTTLSAYEIDRDGGLDVSRETLSVGAAVILSPVLDGEFDIGTTRVTESGTVPRSTDEGLYYALALVRTLQNGTLSGSVISDLDEYGRRTTAEVGRALDLPAGTLRLGAGLSQDEVTGTVDPLYSFAYRQDLPRGQFDIGLEQSFESDSVGNETLDTRFRMRLQQELTARDRLAARLNLREADRTTAVDTREIGIGVDYARDLTEDWAFVSGYTHTRSTEGDGGEETDDIFFIGLSTVWQWRP